MKADFFFARLNRNRIVQKVPDKGTFHG